MGKKDKKDHSHHDCEDPKKKGGHVGMHGNWFTSFWTGPFFKIIPAKKDVAAAEAEAAAAAAASGTADAKDILQNKQHKIKEDDYLGALKRIILHKLDTDGHYGLTNDELVPLPFNAPRAWAYIVDFAMGIYQIAQSTVVMYIAILIDNDNRAAILGEQYSRYHTLIKVLVTLYPLVTLIVMTLFITERIMRKYMYYRLLSMRILVDWENKKIYKSWFFYYFLATWALLNVWSLYGVVKFWNMGQRSGADTVSFATFIIVNLQTVQLLLQYYKLLTAEKRLVNLNAIFERAPVEAQMLLTYTYVIEEAVLMRECRTFGLHAVKAFRKRLLNLITCCTTNKRWHKEVVSARFELDNLKRGADNYQEVEGMVCHLREELAQAAGLAVPPPAGGGGARSAKASSPVRVASPDAAKGVPLAVMADSTKSPGEQELVSSGGAEAAAGQPAEAGTGTMGAAAAAQFDAALQAAQQTAAWMEQGLQGLLYRHFYGTIHAFYTAILPSFPTWPFRGDVAYFRMLLIVELLGLCSVGVITVFGLMRATAGSQCSSAQKVCEECFKSTQQLAGKVCNVGYNITQEL